MVLRARVCPVHLERLGQPPVNPVRDEVQTATRQADDCRHSLPDSPGYSARSDRYLDFIPLTFVVDTASDFSAVPVWLARRKGIDFPRSEASRGVAGGLVGRVEKYLGSIHVAVAGEEFDWPCDFLDSPAPPTTPRTAGQIRPGELPVLGRAGFLAAFAIAIDGDCLTVRRRYADRPWWYRLGRSLLPDLARPRSVNEPL